MILRCFKHVPVAIADNIALESYGSSSVCVNHGARRWTKDGKATSLTMAGAGCYKVSNKWFVDCCGVGTCQHCFGLCVDQLCCQSGSEN